MSINNTENSPDNDETEQISEEFAPEDFELNPLSSADSIRKESYIPNEESNFVSYLDVRAEVTTGFESPETEAEKDPIFAELAEPKLPEPEREDRARLQMQSPNRLFFYWSMKNNPFQVLRKTFGGNTGNYQLVVKLVNRTRDREELYPVETEGNWWFNVDAASSYQAEIGFYAPNRPFIRVMHSNAVETPRKNPSPRQASDADWAVTSTEFAEVLDVSGFTRDAFEVALAGDNEQAADKATERAFSRLIGKQESKFDYDNSEEIRFALLSLASGVLLSELREHISDALYSILQENAADLSAEKSLAALHENFDVFADEITEEETIGAAVFGSSLVNFPKSIKKRVVPRTLSPKYAPRLLSKLSPISSSRVNR